MGPFVLKSLKQTHEKPLNFQKLIEFLITHKHIQPFPFLSKFQQHEVSFVTSKKPINHKILIKNAFLTVYFTHLSSPTIID